MATVKRKPHPFHTSKNTKSERWKTTSDSALQDVAQQLAGNYNNAQRVSNMKARKQQNNTTSINFGNESVRYISDATENQQACFGGFSSEDRATQKERIRKMKADLTTTNFCLGDEAVEYNSINLMAMAEAKSWDGYEKVEMNADLKEAVKKSSLHFGNHKPNYETVGGESMKFHGNLNDFAALRKEVQEQTTTLRKHNFTLGDEKVSYESDYQRGYGSMPMEAYLAAGREKPGIRKIIEDSRACHFSLGQDKVLYQSNNQFAAESIVGKSAATDLAKQLETSKKMKAELMKTSICIGDDATFM